MATDGALSKHERAESYARQAAEAERRGDHLRAAVLYRAAFIALESTGEGEQLESNRGHDARRQWSAGGDTARAAAAADCSNEAE
ncbi:MAG TPA: hypothetical protein VLJ38_22180 [Polyangiaceae bacterium]|nr:hypothetical protein [Polyangiaceae bacterium]